MKDIFNAETLLDALYNSTYRKVGGEKERRETRIWVLEQALYASFRRGQLAERTYLKLKKAGRLTPEILKEKYNITLQEANMI
jgi:hypothetical protein